MKRKGKMAKKDNSVAFDPGYSKHISSLRYFYEQVKASLKVLKTPQQRAFRYKQFLSKTLDIMKKETGFYYGCLLWASYIKYENADEPKVIADNSFYGKTEADLLEFFNQYPKDLAFYRINGEQIEGKYIKTVNIYKEFLLLNKSFINTKTTADLIMPESLKPLTEADLKRLKPLIDDTVTDGNFERLYEFEVFKLSV